VQREGRIRMEKNTMESSTASVCEGANCFAYATTRLVLRVGNKGTISVNVCDGCAKTRFAYVKKGVGI
jgi:hypothetical protein